MGTRDGAIGQRLLANGKELTLYPMLFGNTRLCEGNPDLPCYDRGWCYHDFRAALVALHDWDGVGEPAGFYKRVGEQSPPDH